MNTMTTQEIFTRSVEGILKQGRFGNSPVSGCEYKQLVSIDSKDTEVCCAVGIIEPSLFHVGDFGSSSIADRAVLARLQVVTGILSNESKSLLCELQVLHDYCAMIPDIHITERLEQFRLKANAASKKLNLNPVGKQS